jgi:hypothetical protein
MRVATKRNLPVARSQIVGNPFPRISLFATTAIDRKVKSIGSQRLRKVTPLLWLVSIQLHFDTGFLDKTCDLCQILPPPTSRQIGQHHHVAISGDKHCDLAPSSFA